MAATTPSPTPTEPENGVVGAFLAVVKEIGFWRGIGFVLILCTWKALLEPYKWGWDKLLWKLFEKNVAGAVPGDLESQSNAGDPSPGPEDAESSSQPENRRPGRPKKEKKEKKERSD